MTDQTRHTPAEAVQYWYAAATERREERDRLRAVVARIGQMADYWEQQLPEVIRTPAVVSALRAALEPAAVSGRADDETRDETTPPVHIGGQANAEDCPGCEGTNPPYPFTCPGPDAPAVGGAQPKEA